MAGDSPRFMLFPHTVLSDRDYRHLSLLLPGFSVLQVLRPVAVPEWVAPMAAPWPTITQKDRLETIRLALKGFHEFAAVHGDDTVLTSLSLGQISKSFSESRLRIQSELKRTDAGAVDQGESLLLEAALFLEMARDLDEKELEVEDGLSRMTSLEGEFREILGISEDEELDDTLETMSLPIRSAGTGFSHMLPKRIESWFRLLSNGVPPTMPVLVTTEPVLAELIERLGAKDGAAGNMPEPRHILLASIPAMDGLATEDFLGLLSDPEASDILTPYWQELEKVILSPHDSIGHQMLFEKADTLQDYLREYAVKIGLSGKGSVSIELVVGDTLSWNAIWKEFGQVERPGALAREALFAAPLKILVWRS